MTGAEIEALVKHAAQMALDRNVNLEGGRPNVMDLGENYENIKVPVFENVSVFVLISNIVLILLLNSL